jgi:hypothetical protein
MTDYGGGAMDKEIMVELIFGFGASAAGAALATLVILFVS